jgi:transcriptional regulator with XRE-family HTH domain
MADLVKTLGERLRYAREARRLTQDDVASHFKISRVSVTQWEADRTRPDMRKLGPLADLFGTTVEWLMDHKGNPPLISPDQTAGVSRKKGDVAPGLIAGRDLVGARDLPVYAAAMGGDGHTIVTFDAIDYVKRPEVLQSVKGGYGILIVGESMIPAYWPGDTALVHPHLPPSRDTDCVFYHTPPAGEAEAIVKRLIGLNDRTWTLEQYRPAHVFEEPRLEWPICHRIVGRYNAR